MPKALLFHQGVRGFCLPSATSDVTDPGILYRAQPLSVTCSYHRHNTSTAKNMHITIKFGKYVFAILATLGILASVFLTSCTNSATSVSDISETATVRTLGWPNGIAVDRAGNMYVADGKNHVVRRITPSGVVSIFAGLPGIPGISDGKAADARFNMPSYIAIDTKGNLYVAEGNNRAIRKITPSGNVSTIAGSPQESGDNDVDRSTARLSLPAGMAIEINSCTYYRSPASSPCDDARSESGNGPEPGKRFLHS